MPNLTRLSGELAALTPSSKASAALARLAKATLLVVAGASALVSVFAAWQARPAWAVAALIASGVLLACLRMPADKQVGVGLVVTFTGISLFGAETFLALNVAPVGACPPEAPGPVHQCEAAHRLGRPFDTRSSAQALRELEEVSGETVWPSFSWQGFLADHENSAFVPLGGISDALTLYCNEWGDWISFKSDEFGFRNPVGVFPRVDEDTVVLVGDSFTEGYCQPDGQTIADHLRAAGRSVLNLGRGGNGPLAALATVKEFGTPGGSVVWLYFEGNDLADLEQEKDSPILRRYLVEDHPQQLRERQAEIDGILKDWARETIKAREISSVRTGAVDDWLKESIDVLLLRHLRALLDQIGDGWRAARTPADMVTFREALLEARRITDAQRRTLIFVYLPEATRFLGGPFSPHHDKVVEVVAELSIPLVDLTDVFRSADDPMTLFPNRVRGHYNAAGYALVAREIERRLSSR